MILLSMNFVGNCEIETELSVKALADRCWMLVSIQHLIPFTEESFKLQAMPRNDLNSIQLSSGRKIRYSSVLIPTFWLLFSCLTFSCLMKVGYIFKTMKPARTAGCQRAWYPGKFR